jgi:nucleoside-diphosphate-sugar epimerase
VYNIADDTPVTYRDRELARAKVLGARPPLELPDWVIQAIAPFGSQLLTRTSMRLSTAKALNDLGWHPEYPSITQWAAATRPPVPAAP